MVCMALMSSSATLPDLASLVNLCHRQLLAGHQVFELLLAQLKHEVWGEPIDIAFDRLVRTLASTWYSSAKCGLSIALWPRIITILRVTARRPEWGACPSLACVSAFD